MTCDEYQELIPEYLERTLSAELEQELKRHLATCGACQTELRAAATLSAAVAALPGQQPSAETVLKISEVIQQSAPARRSGEFGPVLDMDDLAQYLRVDKAAIVTYLDELPYFELGGKLLFRRKSVDQWIETRERSTAFQISDALLDSTVVLNP